uniref:Proline rich transmembrane protein 1B n=1 Tax=Homo sapiens TaxID=9606 RepID=A0ABJ7H8H2_HUMAN
MEAGAGGAGAGGAGAGGTGTGGAGTGGAGTGEADLLGLVAEDSRCPIASEAP